MRWREKQAGKGRGLRGLLEGLEEGGELCDGVVDALGFGLSELVLWGALWGAFVLLFDGFVFDFGVFDLFVPEV